jgi:Flp pilus assembly protein TadG
LAGFAFTSNQTRWAKARRKAALWTARALRFRDEEKGATAVEFAMVAAPFIFLILSLIEIALIFLVYSTLDNALIVASRTIRTGALQTGGTTPTAASFVSSVCGNMGWLQSTCTSQLNVDVRTETQFANPTAPDPMSTGTFNPSVLTFTPGNANQIVLVRAFYQWPLVLPVFDAALSKGNNGVAVIVATTTFVNEPYS